MRWQLAPLGALLLAAGVGASAVMVAAVLGGCADAADPAMPIDHPANPLAAVTPLPEPSTTLAGDSIGSVGSPATRPAETSSISPPPSSAATTSPAAPAHDHSGHAGHHGHEGGK